MIAHPALLHALPRRLFDQERVGAYLHAVGLPSLARPFLTSGASTLVFVRDERAVSSSEHVHAAPQSKPLALERTPLDGPLVLLVGRACNLLVQPSPREHGSVSHAYTLDLFEVEESLAIHERVERHDAE